LATTDALTGINNRAALNEKLLEAFERAQRYDRALSVILMDVDHFKKFNDTFGHPAGDEVLKNVAKVLSNTVRGADLVARYGGEEFAIILPDTEYAGAMVLAERCRRAIANHPWAQRAITASIGVSTMTATTGNPTILLQEADDALYRSKQAGRNRVSHHNTGLVPMSMK
jgi:diguanylate cyclase (GGDEF)-like protein